MTIASKDKDLAIQRRDRVDGGLNTRGSPTTVEDAQALRLVNMEFSEEGSLTVRKCASLLLGTTWAGSGLLPAPVLTRLAGGGTLAAGTYEVQYWLSYTLGGITFYTSPSATASIAGILLNDRIQIDIPPNNLGEGVGGLAGGGDDPFNGGVAGPELVSGGTLDNILVHKTTDVSFTKQVLSTAFAWDVAARVRRGVLSAYAVTTTLAATNFGFPLRKLVWHPGIRQMIGITVDKAILFAADYSAFTQFAIANDNAGNPHFWSRIPTPMSAAFLDDIMVISDHIGRPKRLSWTGNAATSTWRLLGANKSSAPVATLNATAGALTGAYSYKVALVYRDSIADLTTLDIESNASPASATRTPAAQKIDVVVPTCLETGFVAVRVYRTKAGGTVYFFHSDVASGAAFTDNTVDASLGTATPVDDVGKTPNDVPPDRLAFVCEHRGRLFAVLERYFLDANSRILDFIATNIGRFTKAPAAGTSEAVNAWPGTFQLELGDAHPVSALVSKGGTLYVFKHHLIGAITGRDETDFDFDVVISGVGAMRYSTVVVGSLIYFWEDARGAMAFDGSSYKQLGYVVQPTWEVDRTNHLKPVETWFDPQRNEIHWAMHNVGIAPIGGYSSFATFVEYVFHIPSGAWTQFNSSINDGRPPARCVATTARGMFSASDNDIYYQFLGTYLGKLDLDSQTFNRTPQLNVDQGDSLVKFKLFLGADWESVKTPRQIVIESVISSQSIISVFMTMLNEDAPGGGTQIGTLTGVTTRPSSRVDYIDIPAETFANLQGAAGDKLNQDRGVGVLLQIQNRDAAATIIRGVSWHYKDASITRRFP